MKRPNCACGECGKPLYRYPSGLAKRKYGVFCNKDCLGLYRTRVLVGTNAANFQNGVARDRKYIMALAPWHPFRDSGGYVYLHRLVIEARLGRFLCSTEVVHHIDGNPENNNWENLEVTTQPAHASEHLNNGTISRDTKSGRFQIRSVA